ncbi:MAG: DinB family protein [Phycisphaeraceae bacterium]|nr:MAG: DinB family protein [Phycisphaeraceae bacterium]
MFNPTRLTARLAAFPDLLEVLVADTDDAEWRWKPDDRHWSITEILGHLLREEREDFRTRLRLTLESPAMPWPPIDPEGDVARHRDINADPAQTLAAFRAERADSIAWLRSLDAPDWNAEHAHPKLGLFRAGDLLAAWADHDALHARQLVKRRHQLIVRDAGPYPCRYAGEWTA